MIKIQLFKKLEVGSPKSEAGELNYELVEKIKAKSHKIKAIRNKYSNNF
jgi:hypothetical protein